MGLLGAAMAGPGDGAPVGHPDAHTELLDTFVPPGPTAPSDEQLERQETVERAAVATAAEILAALPE